MDTGGELVGQSDISIVSSANKWLIEPFFRSLKSKISSFTEIVITPVKVFTARNSLPPSTHNDDKHPPFGMSHRNQSALGGVAESQAQSEKETEHMNVIEGAHEALTAIHKCCRKLNLSAQNSGEADERPTTGNENSLFVPLQQSPSLCAGSVDGFQSAGSGFASSVPVYLSVAVSASQESKLATPGAEEEPRGKPARQVKAPLRKGAGKRNKVPSQTLRSDAETADVHLPVTNSLNSRKDDPSNDETVLSESDGRKSENSHLVGRRLRIDLSDCVNGKILSPTRDKQPPEATLVAETRPASGLGRPKRDLKGDAPSQNAVTRKRVRADQCVNAQSQERPRRKRQAVASKTGKHDGEMLTAISEAGRAPSPENNGGGPEGSNHQAKPTKTRRLKTQTCPPGDDVDLETTIRIRSSKHAQPERLEVLCPPRELHGTRKCRERAKNPPKRKSPTHATLCAEPGSRPRARPGGLLKVKPADGNTLESILEGRSCKVELKRASRRPQKALGSSTLEGSRETKDAHLRAKGKGSPLSSPLRDCFVKLEKDVMLAEDGGRKVSESVADQPFSTDGEPPKHRSARVFSLHLRPRKESQRRKCSVLHSRKNKGEGESCVSKDDSHLAGKRTLRTEQRRQRLRSFSCPDISALPSSDVPWNSVHPARIRPSHQQARPGPPLPHPTHKSAHRARRHTVSGVESEREVAPLCLRKEVYPSRRAGRCDTSGLYPPAGRALSPSTSLSALASCFLSSPLAFLSTKAEGRGASASPGTSSHASSPAASLFLPLSSATKHLPGLLQPPASAGATTEPR